MSRNVSHALVRSAGHISCGKGLSFSVRLLAAWCSSNTLEGRGLEEDFAMVTTGVRIREGMFTELVSPKKKADVWSGTNAQIVADSAEAWEHWVTAHGVAGRSTACFLCCSHKGDLMLLQHQGQVPNRPDFVFFFPPFWATSRFIENSDLD